MRRLISAFSGMGTMCLALHGSATSPPPEAQVLPVQQTKGIPTYLPDIEVRLNSASVSAITIQSVVVDADGTVVDAPPALGAIIAPDPTTAELLQLSAAASLSDPSSVVIAQPDDVVRFASPHLLGLQEGPHVQTIFVSIALPDRPEPQQYSTWRIMDVRTDGIHWLTMREFDDLVTVQELQTSPDGTTILVRAGHVGPPLTREDRPIAASKDTEAVVLEERTSVPGVIGGTGSSEGVP